MIEILNPTALPRARQAGALVADILQTLKSRSAVGTNLMDIDRWAQAMIVEAGALSCYVDYAPSLGRGPFGHYICTPSTTPYCTDCPTTTRLPTEICCHSTSPSPIAGSLQTRPSVSSWATHGPRRASR